MNRIELDALAHCATIVRTDLDHLRELAALPPCDPPAMQSCTDLTNPAWLIRLICPPDGLVLDPFNGAGTTGVAALKYGVRYIGIDRDAHYLDISARRLEACEAAPALFTGV